MVVITAVLLVLLTAAVAWLSFCPKGSPQTATNVGYSVPDDSRTEVTIALVPDAHRTTRCGVQAKSVQEAVVGYREVDIAPDPQADKANPVHVTAHLRTTQKAVQGMLDRCWYVVE
ncbi:DUF4307 domain-containing protein [Brevibacterium sp. 91QC2O2]|uniref:DUF4307 domain-containing protein n=1 Tax=Brevibacterium sp. 91QC2O2 TaxID=2968458 RepID=UPI00211C6AC8|nr:DUF4307 domain-containing protein [Brevibacterium sp. 91QC2O2]MCQ9368511.1 DUF4307 domain-containing protein [Brevibacterium sp. 91QC2O2]